MREPLLAFVHIEKAAGTTLIYLLRRNFLLRYLDVRPLHATSNGIFTARDLRTCLRINPFLRCIGGHAIRPFSELERVAHDLRYITLLRNPIQRYLSQYRYWVTSLNKNWTFERFLEHEPSHDFQTRKIAGSNAVAEAKRLLAERFFLVGVAEQFDEFLVELQGKLQPTRFDPCHTARNVATGSTSVVTDRFEDYEARIRANNARDLELYAFATEELIPRQRAAYAGDFSSALMQFRSRNQQDRGTDARLLLDAISRKVYCEPTMGLLRALHGMPMRGSY